MTELLVGVEDPSKVCLAACFTSTEPSSLALLKLEKLCNTVEDMVLFPILPRKPGDYAQDTPL